MKTAETDPESMIDPVRGPALPLAISGAVVRAQYLVMRARHAGISGVHRAPHGTQRPALLAYGAVEHPGAIVTAAHAASAPRNPTATQSQTRRRTPARGSSTSTAHDQSDDAHEPVRCSAVLCLACPCHVSVVSRE